MNELLMVWNLQDVLVKLFTNFYIEILMVLEASGSCCESIIDGLESQGIAVKPFAHFCNEI